MTEKGVGRKLAYLPFEAHKIPDKVERIKLWPNVSGNTPSITNLKASVSLIYDLLRKVLNEIICERLYVRDKDNKFEDLSYFE